MSRSLLFNINLPSDLALAILENANQLNFPVKSEPGQCNVQRFSDGEFSVDFEEPIAGSRVYIMSMAYSSEEIIKLNLAIDAAKRAFAKEIIIILPYFPYSRQDKKDQEQGPIGAKVIAEMIEQRGATSLITCDLHTDQTQGFFDIPVIHIERKHIFDEELLALYRSNRAGKTVLCGPDAGSGKSIKSMKDHMADRYQVILDYVMLDKTRKQPNVVDDMLVIGEVQGRDIIILDDIIDTAGTLCKAADVLHQRGAASVKAMISHGVLSGSAIERIGASSLEQLIISDSLAIPNKEIILNSSSNSNVQHDILTGYTKIKQLSLARQIGLAITAVNNDLSYSLLA